MRPPLDVARVGPREQYLGELAEAASAEQIVAWFQPQVDARTEQPVAVEALARWQHPRLGLIGPERFIALSENSAAIHAIGAAMIVSTSRALHRLRALGSGVQASVNVSAVQLRSPALLDQLKSAILECALRPGDLTIEVTESRPILDLPAAIATLTEIASGGIGISLDDFSRGHAVPALAERLPLTELKVDMSLVTADARGPAELPALISRLRERRIRTVAEGVASVEHVALARRLGIDRLQGFLFAKPMPLADLERYLAVGSE